MLRSLVLLIGSLTVHAVGLAQTNFAERKVLFDAYAIIPQELLANDLDGDGDQDLISIGCIAAFVGNDLGWHENLGNGDFSTRQILSAAGDCYTNVTTGDFNGDGLVDLAAALPLDDKIIWVPNQGAGSFGASRTLGTLFEPSFLESMDVDDDGDIDIVSNGLVWFENDGAGLFTFRPMIAPGVIGSPRQIADLDGDGDLDLLVINGSLAWIENQGLGVYGALQMIAPAPTATSGIQIADLDDDGDIDIVGSTNDRIVWHENLGSENFGAATVLAHGPALSSAGTTISVSDLDGDGDTDILAASRFSQLVFWLENQGGGVFSQPTMLDNEARECESAIALDVNNDGDLDVVAGVHLSPVFGGDPTSIVWYENIRDSAGCGVPGALSANIIDPTTVNLTWSEVPGAVGYRIRASKSGASFQKVLASAEGELLVTGLPAGESYEWTVRAACALDTSAYAAIASFSLPSFRGNQAVVNVFPNPAQTRLTLKGNGFFQCRNTSGQLVWSGNISGSMELSISGWRPGYYTWHIRQADGTVAIRAMVVLP